MLLGTLLGTLKAILRDGMIKAVHAVNAVVFGAVVGGDSEDRWVPLGDDGSWKYEVRKGTGGKKVHFYVTVTETDHPETAASMWRMELDCSCNNQHKTADVPTGEKHEFSVDTNFWSDTTFDFHLTSINGAVDKDVLVHLVTNTTS
jgi:hypothetical protein|tara:strand:- start:2 stop:439 length:438 start_codon:yes stop_codon:yes gene_type:complete